MAVKRKNITKKSKLTLLSYFILFLCLLTKLLILNEFEEEALGFYFTVLFFIGGLGLMVGLSHLESITVTVRYRINREQFKNAGTMLSTGVFTGLALGLIAGGALYFLRKLLLNLFDVAYYDDISYLVLAVGLFLFISLSSVLGYFSGYDFLMPVDVSRLIFGITDILCSLLFTYWMKGSGEINAALYHDEKIIGAHCALGACLGLCVAVFITLLWNLSLLISFKRRMKVRLLDDLSRGYESLYDQIRALFMASGYSYLKHFLLLSPFIVVMIYFFKNFSSGDTSGSLPSYMVFGALYVTGFISIVFSLGLTMSISKRSKNLIETVMRRDDAYHGGMQAVIAIKQFIVEALPVVCIFDCIILRVYDPDGIKIGGGNVLIVFVHALFLFVILETYLLKGFFGEWKSSIALLSALVVQFLICMLLTNKNCYEIKTILLCNLLYLLVAAILNFVFLLRYMVYKKNLSGNILMPLVCVFAAVLSCLLCMLLTDALGGVIASVLACVISFLIHSLSLVITGSIRENETDDYPQKFILRFIGSFLGFYR